MLGRFDHHGVANRQARRQGAGKQHQRRVPRGDHADHAQGFASAVVELVELVDRDGFALQLVGHAGEVDVGVGQGVHLCAHFPQQLAVVTGFQECQGFGVLQHQLGQAIQQLAAGRGRQIAPLRVVESPLGRGHCTVHIAGIGFGELVPGLAGRGIEAVQVGGAVGGDELTVDKQVEAAALKGTDRGFHAGVLWVRIKGIHGPARRSRSSPPGRSRRSRCKCRTAGSCAHGRNGAPPSAIR